MKNIQHKFKNIKKNLRQERNLTKVHIWDPKFKGKSIGHVGIQIGEGDNHVYLGFWPSGVSDNINLSQSIGQKLKTKYSLVAIVGVLQKNLHAKIIPIILLPLSRIMMRLGDAKSTNKDDIKGAFISKFEADKISMQREPDHSFTLNNLDEEKMKEFIASLKGKIEKGEIFYKPYKSSENSYNCCSIVIPILKVGGMEIEKLEDSVESKKLDNKKVFEKIIENFTDENTFKIKNLLQKAVEVEKEKKHETQNNLDKDTFKP
jgi:hypothetical protein